MFNIREFLQSRPLSWTAISSFEYDPEQWYRKYILNQKDPESKEMIFGKIVGKKLETDPTYLPQIIRHSKMEHPFKVMFHGVPIIGFADTFCDKTFLKLGEYKTGKKEWTQDRANNHGQIDLYCLMNYVTNKIRPEDMEISLWWMPTQENGDFSISFVEPIEKNIQSFYTKRTLEDVIRFGKRIITVLDQMEKYVHYKQFVPSDVTVTT